MDDYNQNILRYRHIFFVISIKPFEILLYIHSSLFVHITHVGVHNVT